MVKSGAGRSGGEGSCLNKKANAHWHFSREWWGVWLCDLSAVTVSTPTLDLMSVDWRTQGQKATELPYNLLSRFSDNIEWSDLLFKKLKSCCKIIRGKENCRGVWKVACRWCLNTESGKLPNHLNISQDMILINNVKSFGRVFKTMSSPDKTHNQSRCPHYSHEAPSWSHRWCLPSVWPLHNGPCNHTTFCPSCIVSDSHV